MTDPSTPTPSAAEIEAWRLRAERAVSRWVGFNDEGCPASVQFARQLLSTIATLTARVANLEAALREIAEHGDDLTLYDAPDVARAALAQPKEPS